LLNKKGFSLVEIVIFIVVFAIGIVVTVSMYANMVGKSSDPTIRLKTVLVAHAIMDEVLSRKWDENTPNGGGRISNPTPAANFGIDTGETDNPDNFNDVDDYVEIDGCTTNESAGDCFKIRGNYVFNIEVSYGTLNSSTKMVEKSSSGDYKIIEIKVTSPISSDAISLYAIKGNF
jgi:MSHA pilin protein MshD